MTLLPLVDGSHILMLSLLSSAYPTNIMAGPPPTVLESFPRVTAPDSSQKWRFLYHLGFTPNMCTSRVACFPLTSIMTKPLSRVAHGTASRATFLVSHQAQEHLTSLHMPFLPGTEMSVWPGCCAVGYPQTQTPIQSAAWLPSLYSQCMFPVSILPGGIKTYLPITSMSHAFNLFGCLQVCSTMSRLSQ